MGLLARREDDDRVLAIREDRELSAVEHEAVVSAAVINGAGYLAQRATLEVTGAMAMVNQCAKVAPGVELAAALFTDALIIVAHREIAQEFPTRAAREIRRSRR